MEVKAQSCPITLCKTINSIVLSWENLFTCDSATEFILYIKNDQWTPLFRGRKQQYMVKNLFPSTCYTFKLDSVRQDVVLESLQFKAATDFEPYFVFHITRAIKQNKTSLLRKIICQRPALLELENANMTTPLVSAIEMGDLQLTTLLLTLGANVNNCSSITGRTPIMTAIYHRHLQIARLLVDKGANIFLEDCNGLTALHYAVDSDAIECIKFVLRQNLDVNEKDVSGWTPLMRAVILECSDDVIRYLLRKGANPLTKDKNGFDYFRHSKLSGRRPLCNGDEINFENTTKVEEH